MFDIYLDYDGYICKAWYATTARGSMDIEDAIDVLDELVECAVNKACDFFDTSTILVHKVISSGNWKKDFYPDYKGNRKKDNFIGELRDYVKRNEKNLTQVDGLEADEIITLMATTRKDKNYIAFTDDKDMHYLLSNVCKINVTEQIIQREQCDLRDFYAQLLAGDAEDNIKGIPRVGMKTAHNLLCKKQEYSLKKVIEIYKEKGISREECEKNIILVNQLNIMYKTFEPQLQRFAKDLHLNNTLKPAEAKQLMYINKISVERAVNRIYLNEKENK